MLGYDAVYFKKKLDIFFGHFILYKNINHFIYLFLFTYPFLNNFIITIY